MARWIAGAGGGALVLAAISGCVSGEDGGAESMEDRGAAVTAYLEALRGDNDLVRGSLEIPPQASLATLSAAITGFRQAGLPVPVVSDDDLRELANRSPEPDEAVVAQVCAVVDGDRARVARVLAPEVESTAVAISEVSSVDVVDLNSAVTAADWVLTADCMGFSTDKELDELRGRILDVVTADAGVLATLNGQGLWEGDSDLPPVEAPEIEPPDLLAQPRDLLSVVGSDLSREELRSYVDRHSEVTARWVSVESSYLEPGTRGGAGTGTIANARDAVSLSLIAGDGSVPAWLADGVQVALKETAPEDLAVMDAHGDVAVLCDAVAGACGTEQRDAALERLRDSVARVGDIPDSDAQTARILEAGQRFELSAGPCDAQTAERWLASAPAALGARAAQEKTCWELLEVSMQELDRAAVTAIDADDPVSAVGILQLRALKFPDPPPVSLGEDVDAALARLQERLDASEGESWTERARPLSFELIREELRQWSRE